MHSPLVAMILMAVAGAAIAVQAPLNSALARSIDSWIAAATVSFLVGTVVLLVFTALSGEMGGLLRAATVPRWLLLGGVLGAFYIWVAVTSVSVLGVLTTTTLLILGQITASIILDSTGAFGIAPRDISLPRIIAAAMVAGGVVLSRF